MPRKKPSLLSLLDETSDPLDILATDAPPTISNSTRVPNQHPTIGSRLRLAIIGEAPGEDEERNGIHFIGQSGRVLEQLLGKCNVLRASVFVGNICQIRPPGNEISKFELDGPEITEGIERLTGDILSFNPNVCFLLGRTALYFAKGVKNLGDWRGSRFIGQAGPFLGRKCIASYHPAACIRNYSWMPLLHMDLRRAVKEAESPELVVPKRDLIINLSFAELIEALDAIIRDKPVISCDIEGGVRSMSCISFARSRSHSFVLPLLSLAGASVWTVDEEVQLWIRLARIMADPSIHKIWQNGLYDRFVLQYGYGIIVKGNKEDTMLKFWESYCELEKSLAFQCSILGDESFYKFHRKTENQDAFYRYCCTDSAVTFENCEVLEKQLNPAQLDHYHFNNDLLNPILYMELRGIKYDQEEADRRLDKIIDEIYKTQLLLDRVASRYGACEPIDFTKTSDEVLAIIQSHICYKRNPSQPKAGEEEDYNWAYHRLAQPSPLTGAEQGRISIMCGTTMNMKSHRKFHDFLYGTCGLPTQWKTDPVTKEQRRTADYLSLLFLSKNHKHPALEVSILMTLLLTRATMLSIASLKGRMHCSYNLVGSETGRVSSSKSIIPVSRKKRVGYNMQTIPDDWEVFDESHPVHQGMRDLFKADPGCYIAKCDLKGADGWTVGAYMAMLGDTTMLDDLKYGIKPAQVVAYILKHGASDIQKHAYDRKEIKNLISEIKKDDWEYFVSKQGIWGTCYTMGPRKLAERVFIESEGKVALSEAQAREFQSAIYVRYRVKLWHDWMQRFLANQPYPARFVAPNGFTRKFFGRKQEILGQALAHMPQVITTYATLKAAHRLWTDPDNRVVLHDRINDNLHNTACRLRIEPLHNVHDELVVQFKIEETEWALGKLKTYFDNPIVVANQCLTIPFDGAYGTNWAMDEVGKVGDIK